MRRAIKIKAYIVLLAWMTIFVHNVIPHNHIDEIYAGCSNLVQSTNPDEHDYDNTIKFKNEPEDISVCHISSLLFHHFTQDNFIPESARGVSFCPDDLSGKLFIPAQEIYNAGNFTGSASLRAPPLA